MTRDDVVPVVPYHLSQQNWRDIASVTLATPALVSLDAGIDVTVEPLVIEVMTGLGRIFKVTYWAHGDYIDRWVTVSTYRTITDIRYWRPL